MKLKLSLVIFILSFFLAVTALAAQEAKVEMFSPQGIIKNVRQVSVRFSEQMIPFGDPRSEKDPFDINCTEKGSSRWADDKNWVYDFAQDISAGAKCEFKLKAGLKALSGKEITGQKVFSFSTGGPSIIRKMPYEGSTTIDEEQVFVLTLDGEPDLDSVYSNVFFSIEGVHERVGIKIIEGKLRDKILKSRFRKIRTVPVILIQCQRRFPSEAKVSLVWAKGVKSLTGVATVQDQTVNYQVRKPFLAEFHCERENKQAGCIPMFPLRLDFNSSVSKSQATKIILKGPGNKIWKPEPLKNEDDTTYVNFKGPFPESTNFLLELPAGVKDDAGRTLVNADKFPLSVRTDKYPPLAKFSGRFGVLESKEEPLLLPVTLRNIEPQLKIKSQKIDSDEGVVGKVVGKIMNVKADHGKDLQEWLRRVAISPRGKSIFGSSGKAKTFQMPKPNGARAFEVVGIPLEKTGLYVVELESSILGSHLLQSPMPMYVPTAVLVTNMAAHFKWGRESSIVWVTTLDEAKPVWDADVTIRDCRDKIVWQGRTDAAGLARIEKALPKDNDLPRCEFKYDERSHYQYGESRHMQGLQGGLFVTAQTDNDFTFVHSSWSEGIESWRFQLPEEDSNTPMIAHTIFDRTLLRKGETVHMKHVFRRHTTKGFSFVPQAQLPQVIVIEHQGSNEKYEMPLKWDVGGIAETEWKIPAEAKTGKYEVSLREKTTEKKSRRYYYGGAGNYISGNFNVEEYRVPLLKGIIQTPKQALINVREVTVDLAVQYLAGGGAGSLPIKLRSEISSKNVSPFAGYDDFVFSNGAVKEGLVRRGENIDEDYNEEMDENNQDRKTKKLATKDLVLDAAGTFRTSIGNITKADIPREILTEMEFHDPNGEIQTVAARVPIWNSQYNIGIKPDSWAAAKDDFKFQVAVLDLSGKPVMSAPVRVDLLERKNYSHRKRLVGGFYAYENTLEVKKIGSVCDGKTDEQGLLICQAKSPVAGNVILQAQTYDEEKRKITANRDIWVADKDDWWFEVNDNDRIDLIAEKKRYEPGEKAKFQVRMPFREATVLISVEREGIIESWVKKVSGKSPVIEVPVKDNYAPNVFVSALVVRGRVAGVKPTSMVDLGKPAYKLGIAEINVGWKSHELKLNISTDRKVYQVRQKAKINIKVVTAEDKAPPVGSEVAVAVVDEGLLELMPNRSWELLAAMMGRRGYGVQTASMQMQVVGKRHFGLKALAQGGGGGKQPTRELFDTLLLWKGRVFLNANGEAALEVPLNDSLTSFKIIAVATGDAGFFGTGSASIRSTQDLMVLSGLPPLVREGDKTWAGFTVRNTTDRKMNVVLAAKVEGLKEQLANLTVTLTPGEAKETGWNITIPADVTALKWLLEVREQGSANSDRLKITQKVIPVIPVSTFQATITQLTDRYDLAVERPADALPGRGGIRATLKPKISAGLNGVLDYMRSYPYTCMEQKVSVAVALRDKDRWKETMSTLPGYFDQYGLVKYFPDCVCGSATLTSYVYAIANEAGWSIPEASKTKMEEGLKRFIEGISTCSSPLVTTDLHLRKISAIEALARERKAQAAMLNSITIEPNLWPTSAVIDWINILRNMDDISGRQERLQEAQQIIRSRLNFQGTTMGFSTQGTDYLWWLMVSNDVNAVRVLLALMNEEQWKADMPRLVQGALARQKHGAWDLTTANAWGTLAMEKFSQSFEATPVTGMSQATLAGKTKNWDWKANSKGQSQFFPWPQGSDNLNVTHKGTGKPWLIVQSLAAIPLKEAFSSGYKIKKTIIPVEQKQARRWSKGDVLRIRLEMQAQADQTWVVVNDPVPAGATILGKGLARESQMLTAGEKKKGWIWPAFEERTFDAFKAYYEYVPKGEWMTEYTIRLNQSGKLNLPTTRVEALYFPEMFGELPNKAMEVNP
jgi:hypothetical protein